MWAGDSIDKSKSLEEALGWNDKSRLYHYLTSIISHVAKWHYSARVQTEKKISGIQKMIITQFVNSCLLTVAYFYSLFRCASGA